MRWLASLVRWELRLQLRSARSRGAVLLYVVVCAVPPGVVFVTRSTYYSFGSSS